MLNQVQPYHQTQPSYTPIDTKHHVLKDRSKKISSNDPVSERCRKKHREKKDPPVEATSSLSPQERVSSGCGGVAGPGGSLPARYRRISRDLRPWLQLLVVESSLYPPRDSRQR